MFAIPFIRIRSEESYNIYDGLCASDASVDQSVQRGVVSSSQIIFFFREAFRYALNFMTRSLSMFLIYLKSTPLVLLVYV